MWVVFRVTRLLSAGHKGTRVGATLAVDGTGLLLGLAGTPHDACITVSRRISRSTKVSLQSEFTSNTCAAIIAPTLAPFRAHVDVKLHGTARVKKHILLPGLSLMTMNKFLPRWLLTRPAILLILLVLANEFWSQFDSPT